MKDYLSPLRIACVYAVFGTLWIFFSDSILHALVPDPELEALIQTFKGWSYVAVTAGLVYLLTKEFAREMGEKIRESERIRAELRDSELRLSRHLRNTPLGCVSWDRDFICTEWNKSAEDIFGFTAEEAIGRHPAGMLLPHGIEAEIKEVFELLLNQQGGSRNINQNLTKDGRTIQCEWYNTPIVDAGGNVVGVSSLVMDITEKMQTEAEMLRAKEGALAANRAKSQFLATMSHEFRTPLNAILGFSEMMMPEYTGNMARERYVDYAKDIHRSGKHMLSLVNDMLDVAEIEAGERHFRMERVEVGGLLRACAHNMAPVAGQAGVEIAVDVPDGLPSVVVDVRSFNQIVLNLLSNAIKFTGPGGTITISARAGDGDLVVKVRDTGIGIPAEKLSTIFEPFTRLNEDPLKTQEGTGLGLSIVRSLVDAHGGKIAIESIFGTGTTITLQFPVDGAGRM